MELALMTGMSFGGGVPPVMQRSSSLRGVFPDILKKSPKCATLKVLDSNQALGILLDGGNVDKARKVVVLYLLYTIVFGKEAKGVVDENIVHLVDHPNLFNLYPWGKVIYVEFVNDFSKARKLMLKNEKKVVGEKKTSHRSGNRSSIMIHTLLYAFQGWFLEGISRKIASLVPNSRGDGFPRLAQRRTTIVYCLQGCQRTTFQQENGNSLSHNLSHYLTQYPTHYLQVTFTQITPHSNEIASACYTSAQEHHTSMSGVSPSDGDDDDDDDDDEGRDEDDDDDASSRSPYASNSTGGGDDALPVDNSPRLDDEAQSIEPPCLGKATTNALVVEEVNRLLDKIVFKRSILV